jgi:hypothetical protein
VTPERPGILGLETEHVILYLPGSAGELPALDQGKAPPFDLLQRILFECLLSGRKAALSSGIKGGYFLENGGLAHLEIALDQQEDVPILEVCTPECRSPQDLVEYSRAYDEILEETSRRSEPLLARYGFAGRLAFGKNNRDAAGTGFGCHENYAVYTRRRGSGPGPWRLALLPLAFLCHLPVVVLCLVAVCAGMACLALGTLPYLGAALAGAARAASRRLPGAVRVLRRTLHLSATCVLYPFLRAYGALARLIAFPGIVRDLTPFLVTRPIFAGAGCLNFRQGVFELSQRADLTCGVARIIVLGKAKTLFDLKSFLFDRTGVPTPWAPLALLSRVKRLSLAAGDSNLADAPNLLKVGATTLLLEMLEAGERFDELRLADPIAAFRDVSRGGPWKELKLRRGGKRTALEIQRAYLSRAQVFFAGRPEGKVRHGAILKLWETALALLADRPQATAELFDWAAKKSLLDRAILSRTNWKVFFAWGKLFELAGLEATRDASSLEDLLRRIPSWHRPRARRFAAAEKLRVDELALQRDLHFEARKIDLRYHELGGGTAYQRLLEEGGWMRRLTTEEAVERAIREPPQDTRARVRGHFIRRSNRPDLLQVSWNDIELLSPSRRIPTPDPLGHELPED